MPTQAAAIEIDDDPTKPTALPARTMWCPQCGARQTQYSAPCGPILCVACYTNDHATREMIWEGDTAPFRLTVL